MKNWILIAILGLATVACRKDKIEPLPVNNEPVFYMNGTFGDQPIAMQAGVDQAYVAYNVDNRFGMKYTSGKMVFADHFLQMGIFEGSTNIESWLANVSADSLHVASQIVEPLAHFSKNFCTNIARINKINWYINGALASGESLTVYQPGFYQICAEYQFVTGEVKTVCNDMFIGFSHALDVQAKHLISGNNNLKLWLEGNDIDQIQSLKWFLDDVEVGESTILNTTVTPGIHDIRAEVWNESGQKFTHHFFVDGSQLGRYSEDFLLFLTHSNLRWDHAIGVEFSHNGELWSTFNAQNFKSSLNVSNISLYETTPNGERIFKVKGTFDGLVGRAGQSPRSLRFNFCIPIRTH